MTGLRSTQPIAAILTLGFTLCAATGGAQADEIKFIKPNKVWTHYSTLGDGNKEFVVHDREQNRLVRMVWDKKKGWSVPVITTNVEQVIIK